MTTISSAGAAEILGYGSASGDFDGDGDLDLALVSTAGIDIWFGPIAMGQLSAGTAPVQLTVPDRTHIYGVLDIDGDGRDELRAGPWFISVPTSGTGSAESHAVVTLVPEQTALVTGDLDGDGSVDLIVGRGVPGIGSFTELVYGPIAGTVEFMAEGAPGADRAFLHSGLSWECRPTPVLIGEDVDEDGRAEIVISSAATFDGCSPMPNQVWQAGDLRGTEQYAVSSIVLDRPVNQVGDTTGDGHIELTDGGNIYELAQVLAEQGLGTALASMEPGTGFLYRSEGSTLPGGCFDYSGDGRAEVLVGSDAPGAPTYTLLDAVGVNGVLVIPADGVRADGCGSHHIADFDGDLVPDRALVLSNEVYIYSGADLRDRWSVATGG